LTGRFCQQQPLPSERSGAHRRTGSPHRLRRHRRHRARASREPLALGRRRRRASKAQRRALLRRDGDCARPGCPETRVERLHAHHLRHWLFGGRTDLDKLVLLCDTDHGLVHDLDLVVARVDGRLVVTAPDGRHVWGSADAAFRTGPAGLDDRPAPGATDVHERATRAEPTTADPFTGVHPIDVETGRRPAPPLDEVLDRRRHPARRRRTAPGRRGRRSWNRPGGGAPRPAPAGPARSRWSTGRRRARRAPGGEQTVAAMSSVLFPTGQPPLPEAVHVNGERMDLRYAVGVLMGHRDLVRRLAAEAGVAMSG
jgi:HNH endonuclease